MTIKEINEYYSLIGGLLRDNMLAEALACMRDLMNSLGDYRLKEKLNEVRNTYSMMLHYFVEGLPDAKRQEMSASLKLSLNRLNDELNYKALSTLASTDYFSLVRSQRLRDNSISQLLRDYDRVKSQTNNSSDYSRDLQAQSQECIYQLFNKIWISQFIDKDSSSLLSDRVCKNADGIEESENDVSLQCAIIVSLYLGIMQYYDPAKVKILLSALLNNRNDEVLARTYVLIILVLSRYGDNVKEDRTLLSLLSLAADNDRFPQLFKEIIINFIRTLDTAKINKTIAEDIIPGLMKMRPDLEKGFREMEKSFSSEDSEYNPEWEDLLRKSGIEEKMRQLSDLQMKGGDMFMMAFAGIKKTAFFRNPANWLLPFNPLHTEIQDSINRLPSEFSTMLSKSAVFCDSDSYSLFIGLKMMPEASVEMMANQIKSQIQHFEEDRESSFALQTESRLKVNVSRFIRDLYRFYNQYVGSGDFFNPFSSDCDFSSIPVAGEYIDNPSDLEFIGTLYFQRKIWKEADIFFSKYLEHYKEYLTTSYDAITPQYILSFHYVPGDEATESRLVSIMEKKGFALMRLKQYEEALNTLLLAQLYQNPSVWTLSRIAECLRHLGNDKLYGEFLDKALSIDADDRRLLLRRSRLYIEEGKYDEAVKLVYKLNYLDPENLLYIRTLAWCRCLQNEPEKALELYNNIPMESYEPTELMNIGHCRFAIGDFEGAVDSYRRFVSISGERKFFQALEEDLKTLSFLKSRKQEIGWIRDAVILSGHKN